MNKPARSGVRPRGEYRDRNCETRDGFAFMVNGGLAADRRPGGLLPQTFHGLDFVKSCEISALDDERTVAGNNGLRFEIHIKANR